jgi:hypothetical protein
LQRRIGSAANPNVPRTIRRNNCVVTFSIESHAFLGDDQHMVLSDASTQTGADLNPRKKKTTASREGAVEVTCGLAHSHRLGKWNELRLQLFVSQRLELITRPVLSAVILTQFEPQPERPECV